MKFSRIALLVDRLELWQGVAIAQAPAGPPQAAQTEGRGAGRGRGGRGPMVVSPQINPDRSITFRYYDPNAQKVTVSGELGGQSATFTKGEDGVWSATIGPL